jgi:SAM-dependent methyltransferase
MDLHGAAMIDYLNGEREAEVLMHRDDGFTVPPIVAARWFYHDGFPILDTKALELCRGNVLNVGASSGSHSLFLESQGLSVVSVDASAQAVEVMRRRQVRNPVVGDITSVEGPFDTILVLCGIGLTGTIEGLNGFLAQAKKHLSPDGILITDCTHPRADTNEASQRYCDHQIAEGRYEGERTVRFEYKGEFGPWFNWLAISPEVLTQHANQVGFDLEVIYSEVGRSLCVLKG